RKEAGNVEGLGVVRGLGVRKSERCQSRGRQNQPDRETHHGPLTWIDRLAAETTGARKLIDHLDQAVLANIRHSGANWCRRTRTTSRPVCYWSACVPSVLLRQRRPNVGRGKSKPGLDAVVREDWESGLGD